MYDLVIRNAQVYDGTGLPPVHTDVAVSDGRITQIGHITDPAHEVIDAQGCGQRKFKMDPYSIQRHDGLRSSTAWRTNRFYC